MEEYIYIYKKIQAKRNVSQFDWHFDMAHVTCTSKSQYCSVCLASSFKLWLSWCTLMHTRKRTRIRSMRWEEPGETRCEWRDQGCAKDASFDMSRAPFLLSLSLSLSLSVSRSSFFLLTLSLLELLSWELEVDTRAQAGWKTLGYTGTTTTDTESKIDNKAQWKRVKEKVP